MGRVFDTEVIVVGAGYAGLTTALHLVDGGRDVVVLEARDRVGGRVWTHHEAGVPLDLGGMWVGANHEHFRGLLARFGLTTFPTPSHGHAAWWDAPCDTLRRARPFPMPVSVVPAVVMGLARVGWLVRRAESDRGLTSAQTQRLDQMTVAAWLRRWVPSRRARQALEAAIVGQASTELAQISMLSVVSSAAEAGGLLAQLGTEGGAQQDLVVDGADAPARAISALLGSRLRLATPVLEIHHQSDAVRVVTADSSITARHVVVTLPPAHVTRLHWAPALPVWRASLLARMPMGSVTKVLAVYDRPFWRDSGWSGEVTDAVGSVSSAFDVSPPGGPGVLASLTCGHRSVALAQLSPEARQQRVIDAFARWFGSEARHPRSVVDVSWENEVFSGGGYSALPIPGASAMVKRIAEPTGRVHFAGTETATRFAGYIDGAISSGARAATEVLARLVADEAGD